MNRFSLTGRKLVLILVGAGTLALPDGRAAAQATSDYAVQATAAVQVAPPRITLSWPAFAGATQHTVYRKAWGSPAWGTAVATLAGSATGYPDNGVAAGTKYEYQVRRTASVTGYGYLATGIEIPLVEDRGKVVLVVDSTMAAGLATELSRLQADLAGDGWTVLRHDVARNAAVPSVKALIKADHDADPTRVNSVFLFGHVPVPYSGSLAPDGHGDHVGAWPADLYYGDMDGVWTDASALGGTGRQNNVPGDGKFDQSYAPGGTVELAVGRVDLANLPAFAPKTESDLLRQYLNKDHAFRVKAWTLPARGLIDDNFGAFGGEAFASTGWRAFSAFFGPANVFALDWFGTLATNGYLWAYGCGGGNYQGAGGVGSTSNFAATDTKTAFTFLFGSYFGDWDVSNDFLRAPLATTTYGLTCAWAGRPAWHVQHMAMGETIGYAARLTQNNSGTYFYGYGPSVHIALMGDPTLRMHVVAPAANVNATGGAGSAAISWTASADAVAGYHVYRGAGAAGPFTRLTPSPVAGTSFVDAGASGGTTTYLVRAVRLETSASGSYWNASTGLAAGATVTGPGATAFHTLAPCRAIDTRRPAGPLGGPSLGAGATRTFVSTGVCGIPTTARSVSANITVTNTGADGTLVLYPGDLPAAPNALTLAFRAGQTRANNALLGLASDGSGAFKLASTATGPLDVIVDVNGWFE
ncbi:MAG: fibronectin type III domain-containing protein [Thermoanaerobaculia bacterium]|nr:fibronectin type III domain-containing protein [Thermoanaerobaculia bacterium]